MKLFRKSQNKYIGIFLTSASVGFVVALSMTYYIYKYYYENFLANPNLIIGTAIFIVVCTVSFPNVVVAIFYNDDKIWEDRLIAIIYAMRFVDLRKADLDLPTKNDKITYQNRQYLEFELLDNTSNGLYLNWRKFNEFVQNKSIEKLISECGPSFDDAKEKIYKIEDRLRALHRLNNKWFSRTNAFLFVWSLLCVISLYGSYVYLTSVYQKVFPYWYEFDKPNADQIDYYIYAANATVRGFFANLFDIFRENPPFFALDRGELIILSARKDFVEVQIFEYVYRTFIALSLIPLFVSVKRLIRRWRLVGTLRKRIGVETHL